MGGAVAAIEKGYIQKEIQDSAFKYQREIEEEKRIVVGLNKYKGEAVSSAEILRVDPAVRVAQVDKLKRLREKRDNRKVEQALLDLKREGRAGMKTWCRSCLTR